VRLVQALVASLFGLGAFARAAAADCPPSLAKTLPVARGAIQVDGRLDDPTWQAACFVDDFTQKQPRWAAPPSHPIKVAVAIDGHTLYIAARMWSAGPDDISDALTQRDDTSQAERLIVSIDPSHTRRLAYSFAVTARGVRADWIHTDDAEFKRDPSWNPVWVAKAELVADGWTAELAIPLSQLRLPRTPQSSWGINFNWYIPHRQEDVFWISVPPDQTAWASMFGQLTELPPIKGGLGLEVLPYVATRVAFDEDPSAPGDHRWLAGFEAGVDVKLRPLPGLTVTATINPDFGQVEADPAFVNLTAFEVRLPERRPFFVENQALFANSGASYFYSRRIGASGARILGALAAGGYVAEQTQVAVLGAVTDRNEIDGTIVAPLTGWSAARVEHQIGPSVLGATATAVGRSLTDTGLDAVLPSSAFVAGVDARLRTADRAYQLDAFAGVTSIYGSAAAIERVQLSSAHYFQRPDQSYLAFDPSATSLLGWHGSTSLSKRAGMWQGTALLVAESPRYELNDIGTLASADDIDLAVDIKRHDTTPTERVFSWNVGGGIASAWNFGGDRRPVDLHASAEVVTQSFSSASATAHVTSPGLVDELTRGGPSMRIGWTGGGSLGASTPRGTARQLTGTLSAEVSPTLQQGVVASLSLAARITPALRLDLVPSLTVVETERQYVATVTDAGGGADTYGARYLFGHLHRKEAALELRTTWSLSPDLVLTLYAQPFFSVGRYDRIGELVASREADVRWYATAVHDGAMRTIADDVTFSIKEPDFRVASLRSTLVLRWELAPGSTLFVVWQQLRGGIPLLPVQTLHSTVPDAFTQPALHTLALKLSYWFG
jgi:hypothetical protein